MDEPKIISTFSNRRCDKSVFLYSNQIIVSDRLFWCLLRRRQFKTCVKDWLTCHDPNCNPGGVSMCLSVPLWVEAQWRTPLLRPVCVCVCVSVFRLFTMVVFVVKTKAIITITSASFSDHKTTNTHEPPPPPPNLTLTPGYSGERGRERKKERKKRGRERSGAA